MPFTDESRMPFGIHKDKLLKNVPSDHWMFLLKNNILYGELKDYAEARRGKFQAETSNTLILLFFFILFFILFLGPV